MFLLNRVVMTAVTLIGVAVIVFFLLRIVPGDPIAMMISPGASAADIAALLKTSVSPVASTVAAACETMTAV